MSLVIDILLFLLVLSVLVAVHEFGHFIAAKACDIYVDRFSVGMPPRLFGFKYGETDYCIGALPIGGYVKMAGQEDAPMSDEEREQEYGHVPSERFFNNKPVWQRAIVLVAGPAMNVVLAVILYGLYAGVGKEVPEAELSARIGSVAEGAPAASAPLYPIESGTQGDPVAEGWQINDVILSVDGDHVENIQRLALKAIIGGEDNPREVVLERRGPDGETRQYLSVVTPRRLEEDAPYPVFGVTAFETPEIADVKPGLPAESAGLQEGDYILAVNGDKVDRRGFIEAISNTPEGALSTLRIEREGEILEREVRPATTGRIEGMVFRGEEGSEDLDSPAMVMAIEPELSEETGIQAGDRIVTALGEPVTYGALLELERGSPGATLPVEVERPAKLFGLRSPATTFAAELEVSDVRWVGVEVGTKMVYHKIPASQIIPEAFSRSYEAITLTLNTLVALFSRNVHPKELGGPVMIFDVTTKAAEVGWLLLIRIMAFISINLAIFNLLPLPVLDGGQLVLNFAEAVRGKPVNPRFVEAFQQVGLLMIIGLMLFVTWNDIGRLLGGS